MSYSDRSDFDRERDRLIAEIADNLTKCLNSVNQLNRNIENVTAVGNFESVHDLWSQFQDVVARGSYDEAVQQPDPILQSSRAHDEAPRLPPPGGAPGGGEMVQGGEAQ
ncbi:DASH complex subunit Dad1-domain-containing protein [Rhodotorula diobovata]|uniref:DASH complex subunit DAD1 n=1 Tax=Rhodotorula diobovata TaxID=5288 RepID=A0A5C5FRI7_9BASI|nr:DASH complex subunit Dad1-domain-containing protein [Rhodotorula diobovata]